MGRLGFISTLEKATGTLTGTADNEITQEETCVIGGATFVWTSPIVDKYSLLYEDDYEACLERLVKAINLTGVIGTDYLQLLADDQATNPSLVTASRTDGVVTFSAKIPGRIGNDIHITVGTSGLAVSGAHLTGGSGNLEVAIDEIQAHSQMNSEVDSALKYMEDGE